MPNLSLVRTRSLRSYRLAWLAMAPALGATALSACGGSDETKKAYVPAERDPGPRTKVTVTTEFPDESVQGETGSVHVWVIDPGKSGITCDDLVGRAKSPYDPALARRGDFVSKDPSGVASSAD